jgi:hypothetical protein
MATLFEPRGEDEIATMMASILGSQYGGISVHHTQLEFHDVAPPPASVLTATRNLVISQLNAETIKAETRRRIYTVMRDDVTQTNINSWAMDLLARQQSGGALSSDETSDLAVARSLVEWVSQTRDASRVLVGAEDPTYANDSHWPPPPGGYDQFINKF